MKKLLSSFYKALFFCTYIVGSNIAYVQAKAPEQIGKQVKQVYQFKGEGIFFSNMAQGTRLNHVNQIAPHHYQVTISPEFIPTHSSSFFAFQLWAKQKQTITLSVKYTEHKHRYVPKVSHDRKHWHSLTGLIMSEQDSVATFDITLSPQKLWLASQEIETSQDTYTWLDSLIADKPFISKHIIGKSVLQQDLLLTAVEQKNVKPSLILIARQHPPETPGGSIAFKAFYQELVSTTLLATTFRNQFNIYTFPLLNPDGVDNGQWRHNANGQDLNRDWVTFTQPETQAVRDYLAQKIKQEGKTIWFGIDFHTSLSGPYLLIFEEENEKNTRTKIIPKLINKVKERTPLMAQYRRRPQHSPYASNWFYNTYGAEAITYEEGDETDRNIIKARAILYARKLMETMIAQLTNASG